ncbi:MAG TPA: hypothetical protein VKN36_05385 [Eudoraea sp.]|nr:hypothetical protein [Eudoraea sp.]
MNRSHAIGMANEESLKINTPKRIFFIFYFFCALVSAQELDIPTILSKANGIKTIAYDEKVVVTSQLKGLEAVVVSSETKVWIKEGSMRKEFMKNGKKSSVIFRPDGVYVSKEQSLNNEEGKNPDVPIIRIRHILNTEGLENQEFKVFGREEIQGAETVVLAVGENDGSISATKYWIWIEKGIPLRYEQVNMLGGSTIIVKREYSRFDFFNIPDVVFAGDNMPKQQ